jgi:uncharacterized protein YeaO (DUF488 family)
LTKEKAGVNLWMKEIGPSDALRKWFGHKPENWLDFQKGYRTELAPKKVFLAELKQVEKEHGTVTLLFGAKDEKHNQAVALASVLKGKA